jgi:hypothetical protein
MKAIAYTVLMLALPMSILSAPPPWIAARAQRHSSEAVTIRVAKVTQYRSAHNRVYVKARAKVLSVDRTRSRLRPGSWITIRYKTRIRLPRGMFGAAPTPVLKRGNVYNANLNRIRHTRSYKPAAGFRSFKLIHTSRGKYAY